MEISSDYYQRPYQFLLRLVNRSLSKDLDKYSFANSIIKLPASGEVIVTTVLKYVVIMNISNKKGYISVCEITFEKWVDTLSGHDKISMDIDRIVWT